jgi:hypothetical protein
MLEPSPEQMRALIGPCVLALAGGLILVLVDQDSAVRFLGFVPLAVAIVLGAWNLFRLR